jgi:hypothetical protein
MEIVKMYDAVFKDMVLNYIENMGEDNEITLSEEEINDIANKLIFKSEYIWEVINETIDLYIYKTLLERNKKEV